MSVIHSEIDARDRSSPEDLTIDNRPWRDDPWSALQTTAIIFTGAAAVGVLRGDWAAGTSGFVLLALAAWRLWVPVRFRFTPLGLEEEILGFRRLVLWTTLSRYEIRAKGILLLPLAEKSPINILRGIYLAWGTHRQDVLSQVEHHLKRA